MTTTKIEWRVTCLGLQPRYFNGQWGRLDAHRYAEGRPHLQPTIWWRQDHGRGTSPWIDITDRDPNTVEASA